MKRKDREALRRERHERQKRQREANRGNLTEKREPTDDKREMGSSIEKMEKQNPGRTETNAKPEHGPVNWVKNHKVTSSLVGLFVFSLGGLLNYFGSNPRILYLPALTGCAVICWIVMFGTHKYVQNQIANTSPPSLSNTNNPASKQMDGATIPTPLEAAISKPQATQLEENQWQPPLIQEGTKRIKMNFGGFSDLETDITNVLKGEFRFQQGLFKLPVAVFIKDRRLFVRIDEVPGIGTNVVFFDDRMRLLVSNSQRALEMDVNMTSRKLEIVVTDYSNGKRLTPILQVYYKFPNIIEINGYFQQWTDSKTRWSVNFPGLNDSDCQPFTCKVKPWFKYPSGDFPGVLDQ